MKRILSGLWGGKREFIEQARVAIVMIAVTAVYESLSALILKDAYTLNMYEFVGTWSGLVCVWLSRTRNILCWPWGILSSLMLGLFFAQIGLPGQQWLNWIYFMIVQLWAWPHWAFGGKEHTELPVTDYGWKGRMTVLGAIVLGTWVVYSVIDYFAPGSSYPIFDALVVSASVTAQYLLGRKKVESWVLWLGPVNLVSIFLFFAVGAYTLTALYVAFLVHAIIALRDWQKVKI